MFGPRLTKIFASRWHALWWAATILLLAWLMVPSPDEQAPLPAGKSAPVANPWAMDPPDTGRR